MNAENWVANALVAVVALQHVAFFVLESFLWTTPVGLKVFRQRLETAQLSAALAKNQGVYNAFLAAGLVVGLLSAGDVRLVMLTFVLACVVVAGVVGGATVSWRITLVQSVPAAAALLAVRLG